MGFDNDSHQYHLKLREELDALQQGLRHQEQRLTDHVSNAIRKDRTIKLLESEIQSLRVDLNFTVARGLGQQATPDSLGDSVPRAKYDALQNQYERVIGARDSLESRCRLYKETLKEWREYEKIWIMKKGPHHTTTRTSVDSRVSGVPDKNDIEIPAPPVPPEGNTQTPIFESTRNEVAVDVYTGVQHRSGLEYTSRGSVDWNTHVAPATSTHLKDLVVDDTVETSTGSSSRPTTASDPQRPDDDLTFHQTHTMSRLADENDNTPIIVSERSLKRKRPLRNEESKITINTDRKIKDEAASSSPVTAVSVRPLIGIEDSLDLDDIGQSFDTPRKRQRLAQIRLMSSISDASGGRLLSRLQRTTSQSYESGVHDMPTSQDRENLHSVLPKTGSPGPFSERSAVLDRLEREEKEKRHRKVSTTAEQNELNDRVNKPRASSRLKGQHQNYGWKTYATPHLGSLPDYRSLLRQDAAILNPKDPNALSRTSKEKIRRIPPRRRDHGAAHLPAIAEDGEDFTRLKGVRPSPRNTKALEQDRQAYDDSAENGTSSPYHRLGALLKDTSPQDTVSPQISLDEPFRRSLASPKTPSHCSKRSSVHRAQHNFFTARAQEHSAPNRPSLRLPKVDSKPSAKMTVSVEGPNPHGPPEVLPEQEPLRVRSIDRLRLSDFKLNKNHSEYAFHESIRKHDEKKKVAACTDPFCERCKEIARFAELTDFVTPPVCRLFGASPLDTEAAEQQLLEEFLGNDKQRLTRMDATEKKETLKRAREKSFADMYGKHRQLHNRAVSPPGYWETDFPSTQQEAENREAAKAIDKVRIRERYDEAMRGGLWKFADE